MVEAMNRFLAWLDAEPWRLIALFGVLSLPLWACFWYMAKHTPAHP